MADKIIHTPARTELLAQTPEVTPESPTVLMTVVVPGAETVSPDAPTLEQPVVNVPTTINSAPAQAPNSGESIHRLPPEHSHFADDAEYDKWRLERIKAKEMLAGMDSGNIKHTLEIRRQWVGYLDYTTGEIRKTSRARWIRGEEVPYTIQPPQIPENEQPTEVDLQVVKARQKAEKKAKRLNWVKRLFG